MKVRCKDINYLLNIRIFENNIKQYDNIYIQNLFVNKEFDTADDMIQKVMQKIIDDIIFQLKKEKIIKDDIIEAIKIKLEKVMIERENDNLIKINEIIFKPIENSQIEYNFKVDINAVFNFWEIKV